MENIMFKKCLSLITFTYKFKGFFQIKRKIIDKVTRLNQKYYARNASLNQ